jgi:hypothetical protein
VADPPAEPGAAVAVTAWRAFSGPLVPVIRPSIALA